MDQYARARARGVLTVLSVTLWSVFDVFSAVRMVLKVLRVRFWRV
ncbi:Hypothetical protein, conserved [Brucella abortus str. 2308 A]|uniref:Uncharacterized protein n=1 Tax=Brucella melitensis biotype 2 (strain ATCC 23457) TaxID=546272 RepID=C0RGW9_BRUMB|nr:Hypothetical protein, conserved [Brucella melitensis ATCC 23457]AEW16388.1 hypothetical protein BAA13334_I00025 [Brucella abortus A13334]EEP63782.1 Hypothetical protein, conserved [Brucella abortus str. 2308 A]